MSRRRGLGLLEILIGAVILAIALIPLFALSIRNTRGIAVSIDEIEATSAATGLLEALQVVPWELLEPNDVDGGVPLEDLPAGLLAALHLPETPDRFRFQVEIREALAAAPSAPSGTPAEVLARVEAARELRVVKVRCLFRTRRLEGASGNVRDRTIQLVTILSRSARGY